MFAHRYGVEPDGNVHEDPHGEFTGKNILYVQTEDNDTQAQIQAAIPKLLEARPKRVRPHLDDKTLTSWTALMIPSCAQAPQALDEPRYLAAAQRAADFILQQMYNPSTGTLLRRYRDGEAGIHGFLDDYAFLISALLDLYETDFNPQHLEMAVALTGKMRELFEDPTEGAFFTTAAGDDSLVLRMKDDYDGTEPSGNSIALLRLLRLVHITDRRQIRAAA